MAEGSVATMTGVMGRSVAESTPTVSCQQMPLSIMKSGEKAVIAKVREKGDLQHHLETMGFVEGAEVEVMNVAHGDLIVKVKGVQVALGRQVASRIVTRLAS